MVITPVFCGGSAAFTVDAGVRIHGQASRRPYRTPKKRLRLYFRSKYGVAPLNYPIFDFGNPVMTFDRLVIRNVGNRHWAYYDRDQRRETDYINDEWSRRTWLQMGHLSAHGAFAHVYLDGLYWGIYNVVARLDENFTRAYMGGTPADYDLISIDEDLGNIVVADAGTTDAYNALLNTLAGSGAVSNAIYRQTAYYSKLGGSVANGFVLAMAKMPNSGAGDIYYTSDSSDPRAIGGEISSTATQGGDSANVTISRNMTVKARVKNGSVWSPLMDYSFTTSGAGNISLSATATDNNGASGSAAAVNVTITGGSGAFLEQAGTLIFRAHPLQPAHRFMQ